VFFYHWIILGCLLKLIGWPYQKRVPPAATVSILCWKNASSVPQLQPRSLIHPAEWLWSGRSWAVCWFSGGIWRLCWGSSLSYHPCPPGPLEPWREKILPLSVYISNHRAFTFIQMSKCWVSTYIMYLFSKVILIPNIWSFETLIKCMM